MSISFAQQTNETINIGGINREYIQYLPVGFDATTESLPVVFVLHGLGDINSAMEKSGFNNESKQGLIKLVTKDLERNLHNIKLKYEAKSQMVYANQDEKAKALKKLTDEIDSIEQKIDNIKNRLFETELCSICYEVVL